MSKETEKSKIVPASKGEKTELAKKSHFMTPFDEFERLADDFFRTGWLRSRPSDWPSMFRFTDPFESRLPKVDIIDRDEEVFIKAELPGIDKKDINVSLSDHTITINGSSRKEKKEEKGNYYRSEISRGEFSRNLSLPAEVDIDKSKARFKDGILELHLPKIEQSKRRVIQVE